MTDFLTTIEIAREVNAAIRGIQKWAEKNGVQFIGEGKGKTYLWTEADIERFKARPRAGRPRKGK
jgi:predicted DNA-binding protein (UPF0278 family)